MALTQQEAEQLLEARREATRRVLRSPDGEMMLLWLEERLYRALPGKTEPEMAANAGAASVVSFLRHHREARG